jgi:putative hydrolase of the HAD superfamily
LTAVRAVLWDFGGVISTSPFERFAAYERQAGLPVGLIRHLNATNPDTNAWAHLERNQLDLDGFCAAFEAEAAALGHTVDGRRVIETLRGELRPEMVDAVRACRRHGLRQACLTNDITGLATSEGLAEAMGLFDAVVASSVVGMRKPEPGFYTWACEALDVEPVECVFLDDLGVNLRPARAMGMTTIKVESPEQALAELEAVVGFALK